MSVDIYNDGDLEWLHLDAVGLGTSAATEAAWASDDFRLATVSEAQRLMESFSGIVLQTGGYTELDGMNGPMLAFKAAFGHISGGHSYGLVAEGGMFGANSRYMYTGYGTSSDSWGKGGAASFQAAYYVVRGSATIVAVPESSVIALFGIGLAGLGFARRRQS